MSQMVDAADDLDLSRHLQVLRRRWPWVLVSWVVVLGLATGLALSRAPSYCTEARVLIADSEAQVAIQGDANVSVANRDLANEINIARSDLVTSGVEARLGTLPDLAIDGDAGSDVLSFRACSAEPAEAARQTNTWADVYVATKQQQAADIIALAVGGFQERLSELRGQRQELRAPLDELQDRLAGTPEGPARATLESRAQRLENDLAVELQLIDGQIQTIARNITLLELDSDLARTGSARVIQVAAVPLQPDTTPIARIIVMAAFIGLLLGAALALTVENLDRSIDSADDIMGLPVLGSIPRPGRLSARDLSLATMNHTGTPVAEAYQKVRSAIEFTRLGRPLTSIMVTSPNKSEGKTTTSCNLAWALSAIDHRVVLADVDFRRPRIHEVFGCRSEPGLSDHLLQRTPLNRLALRVDDDRRNLVIIPTGARPPSPADFVAAPAFGSLISSLEHEADLVVLDAPPVLPVSDALSMASRVDGVIVVARAGSTSQGDLQEAVEALRAVGADLLGVCLIGVKKEADRYNYGAHPEPEPDLAGRSRSRIRREPAGLVSPARPKPTPIVDSPPPNPARRSEPQPDGAEDPNHAKRHAETIDLPDELADGAAANGTEPPDEEGQVDLVIGRVPPA
jgi:non-specific protein-tyrosine kinase